MHQISSKVGRTSRQIPKIDRLEAEYQKNQERIRQLHRRNRDLAEQMRTLQGTNSSVVSLPVRSVAQRSAVKSRRPKSFAWLLVDGLDRLNKTRIGKYSIVFWIKAAIMMLIVAIVCGSLGFMVTRLIGLLIGG